MTRIARLRATPATVPHEAPLRHGNGVHRGRFVRTPVEVETDDRDLGWPGWNPRVPNADGADPAAVAVRSRR